MNQRLENNLQSDATRSGQTSPFAEVLKEMSSDKKLFAYTVAGSFGKLDRDGNAELEREELSNALDDSRLAVSEQAAAKILLENFDAAKSLAMKGEETDIGRDLGTITATNRYREFFSGDTTDQGISVKDVLLMNLLESENGAQTLTDGTELGQVINGTFKLLGAVTSGFFAVTLAGLVCAEAFTGPLAFLLVPATVALAATSAAATVEEGAASLNEFFNYAPDELNAQFQRHKKDFESWHA